MTEHLRWGILGTGWIARQMTSDLAIHGSPVTAVGSRTQAKADAYAAEFGIRGRLWKLRGPRGGSGRRRHLRRDAAPVPRRGRDARARGGQARAGREAVHDQCGGGEGRRRSRARPRTRRARGDVDALDAAHGPAPRDHRRGHARRRAHDPGRSQPEAVGGPGTPPPGPGARRRSASRPRDLPGLVRLGRVRCADDDPRHLVPDRDRGRSADGDPVRLRGWAAGRHAYRARHLGPQQGRPSSGRRRASRSTRSGTRPRRCG